MGSGRGAGGQAHLWLELAGGGKVCKGLAVVAQLLVRLAAAEEGLDVVRRDGQRLVAGGARLFPLLLRAVVGLGAEVGDLRGLARQRAEGRS